MNEKKPKLPSLSKVKRALLADWALRVKQRDGWKCLLCGNEDLLTAHHWYVCDHHAHAARYSVDNGATLCYACHIRGVHQRADMATIGRLFDSILASAGGVNVQAMKALADTELTTPVLRTLWDAMRARPVDFDTFDTLYVNKKNAIVFATVFLPHPVAVVGNTATTSIHDLFEITTVAKTEDGHRYTLKPLTAEVPE